MKNAEKTTQNDDFESEREIDKNTVTHFDIDGYFKPLETAKEAFKRPPYYLEPFNIKHERK